MAKRQFNLNAIQAKVKSDRTLTSEQEAREAFWTPTTSPGHSAPGLESAMRDTNNDNHNFINYDNILHLELSQIKPDPDQPRKHFSATTLEELMKSIRERGVEQPITVRKTDDGYYKIVAGERRWRACSALGLKTIPAVLKELNDAEAYISALTENIQREDLHFLDEALAFQELINKGFAKNPAEIVDKLGISKQRVSDKMSLVDIPESVKQVIYENKEITSTHALVLAQVNNEEKCVRLAKKIVAESLSVRRLKSLLSDEKKTVRHKSSFQPIKANNINNGFNMAIKFRKDRPEDVDNIIKALEERIAELIKYKSTISDGNTRT